MTARFDVAVVGASAGGVEAIGRLLDGLGARDDLAVVVVLHMSPDHPSWLPETLSAHGGMPVREAVDKAPLSPGVVIVAAPGYHLLVESDRTLAMSCDPPVHFSRPSIDVLFDSAADALGPRVAGVLLTGANADGAAGLHAIQRAGGLVLVQDPDTAVAPEMPRAALAVCRPDALGTPHQLGAWLAAHAGEERP